jgi:hypothetical protein
MKPGRKPNYGKQVNEALKAVSELNLNPIPLNMRMNSCVSLQTERMLLDELFLENERNILASESEGSKVKMNAYLEGLSSTRSILGSMIDAESRIILPGWKPPSRRMQSMATALKTPPERPWLRQMYASTASTDRGNVGGTTSPVTKPFEISPPAPPLKNETPKIQVIARASALLDETSKKREHEQAQPNLDELLSISPRSDHNHSDDDLDYFPSQFVEQARLRTEANLRLKTKRKPLRLFVVKTPPKQWKNPKYAHVESQYSQRNLPQYHGGKFTEHESSVLFQAAKRHYWGKSEEACTSMIQRFIGAQMAKGVKIDQHE